MRFVADGIPLRNRQLRPRVPAGGAGGLARPVRALEPGSLPGVRARFDRWYRGGRTAALNLDYRVDIGFVTSRATGSTPAW